MTILRTLISEMIETYLEEETGLQTAKNLSKHFGSTPNRITGKPIQSQNGKTATIRQLRLMKNTMLLFLQVATK